MTGSVIIFFSGGRGGNELATGKPAEGEIPVVTAPETPAKTATEPAEDASAGAASARKKQIYDRIVGDQEVQGDSQVVPTEVTPIEPQSSSQSGGEDPALELPPADATGVGGEDIPLPLPPPPEDDPGTQGSLGGGDSQQLAASGPPESQGTGNQAGDPSLALMPPDGGDAGAANTTQATPPSTEQPADAASESATTPPSAPAEDEPAAGQDEHEDEAAGRAGQREHREDLQRREGEAGDEVEVQPDELVERVVRGARVPLLVLHAHLARVAGEAVGQRGDEGGVFLAVHHGSGFDSPQVRPPSGAVAFCTTHSILYYIKAFERNRHSFIQTVEIFEMWQFQHIASHDLSAQSLNHFI